jgi:hypothetical protein
MDAKTLKERLTVHEIKTILKSLGGVIWEEDEEKILLNTICHGGDSPNKLCYWKDSKTFFCFTHCGIIDILAIVSEVKDLNLPQSINYICTLLGISDIKYGFTDDRISVINDWDFINAYKNNYNRINKKEKEVLSLNKNILNIFQPIYTSDWINDGITKEVMIKYDILYSTLKQSIIIPHFNINNDLIGIRQRAILDFDVDNYGKYTPVSICGNMYNHPLGLNLYGINENKEIIKKKGKVMLVESEKGVLQCASMFGINNNFTLALCGCAKVSKTQLKLLLSLGINEVIIGLDRQYETTGSDEYFKWLKHLKEKIINPLLPYFKVYVLWDNEELLGYKQSPTDCGKETLLKLMKNKVYITN